MDGCRRGRDRGRLRRRPDDLPLPVHHRDPRPGVLHPVRELDLQARLAADTAGRGGLRRHPPRAHVRQLRLLPGRRIDRAAVHGRPADDPGRRVLDRRRYGSGGPGPDSRGVRGAHVRRPGRPARRAALGSARGPDPRAVPARGVHQPLDLQRAGRADPVPRRALPGHRLARRGQGRCQGGRGAWRPRPRPDAAGAHRRGERHPAGDPVLRHPAGRPLAAGGAADRRAGGRRALRQRRRAGAEQAVPGQHQELTGAAGADHRRRDHRHAGGDGVALGQGPARGARKVAAQPRGRAGRS